MQDIHIKFCVFLAIIEDIILYIDIIARYTFYLKRNKRSFSGTNNLFIKKYQNVAKNVCHIIASAQNIAQFNNLKFNILLHNILTVKPI